MSEDQSFSQFCVYTIVRTQKLDDVYNRGGSGGFTENKVWAFGSKLVIDAKKKGMRVPIIFGAAEDDSPKGLIYHAVLESVETDSSASTTEYKFSGLKPIDGIVPLSSLKLKSKNQPLSNDYIRPYAICYTPSFID